MDWLCGQIQYGEAAAWSNLLADRDDAEAAHDNRVKRAPMLECPRRSTLDLAAGDLLTPAQVAVVALVAEGLANKDVAHRLGVTKVTVKSHVAKAMKRLGLTNRVQVALWYVRRSLSGDSTS